MTPEQRAAPAGRPGPPGGAALTIDALGKKCPIPIIMLAERIREDEHEAKVIDAELDAAEAAQAAEPEAGGTEARRPWWESDQRFAERFEAIDSTGTDQPTQR